MIYGIAQEDRTNSIRSGIGQMRRIAGHPATVLDFQNLGVAFDPDDHESGRTTVHEDRESGIAVVFYGTLFNVHEIETSSGSSGRVPRPRSHAERVFRLYQQFRIDGIGRLNGGFLCIIQDPDAGTFIARDQIGIEPLYYHLQDGRLVFGNTPGPLFNHPDIRKEIEPFALYRYLLFNYIPGETSIFKGIRKLRPGHLLTLKDGRFSGRPYWRLSFAGTASAGEEEISGELLNRMREAVRIRMGTDDAPSGVLLSGGMDSSTVVQIMRGMSDRDIHSFSFRCRGKSFDESRYAEIMSGACDTRHRLVEYGPESVLLIDEMVGRMDEPFCDIGIEIATYLLGREMGDGVRIVLTGDGGDELFAGHPVYLADRTASKFEKLPARIRRPVTAFCQTLPDTDRKKSLTVKAKRFAYSLGFSPDLYSNRWRIYYSPDEISGLATPAFAGRIADLDPLAEIRDLYREADGPDALSRSLYGDYHTVVQFYLGRLRLLRYFGVEGRFPLLDPGLAAFAATIPSALKIKKGGEMKYILHRTMEGILPDAIVHRKDKLGHSVPFKNWIRDAETVQGLIRDVLSEESVRERGLFNAPVIRSMIGQHLRKTHNHSHRLWALVVLELWMRKHL